MFREYKIDITKVYDLDTITNNMWREIEAEPDFFLQYKLMAQQVRLLGLNAPEVRGEEREKGLEARDWMIEMVRDKEVFLSIALDKNGKNLRGKYGRLIGVYNTMVNGEYTNLNQLAIEEGHAFFAEYDLRTFGHHIYTQFETRVLHEHQAHKFMDGFFVKDIENYIPKL